jgi:hypothetical protein
MSTGESKGRLAESMASDRSSFVLVDTPGSESLSWVLVEPPQSERSVEENARIARIQKAQREAIDREEMNRVRAFLAEQEAELKRARQPSVESQGAEVSSSWAAADVPPQGPPPESSEEVAAVALRLEEESVMRMRMKQEEEIREHQRWLLSQGNGIAQQAHDAAQVQCHCLGAKAGYHRPGCEQSARK